ncbi:MAG: pyridoxamine 5'-phosphate oxidase family protein [Proteobacteria bacterium]|nr:pyridoxamine 5'-phosphate oxidase family protein [Pseudomonadota bacterium]
MGQQFPALSDEHRAFIARQKMFFVATAAPGSRVNVSPKGLDAFRVLGPNEAAYLDLTGSGSETRAHLLADESRRITIMFCAFEGSPVILRLYGKGQSLMRGTPEYEEMRGHFEDITGARQIVRITFDLVQTSCGMGVPLYDFKDYRQSLPQYWLKHGLENLKKYWAKKNAKSIDGLETAFDPEVMGRR